MRLAAVATCCGELATCWAPAVRWQDTEESAKAPPMILSAKVDTHNADDEVVVGGKILSLGSGTSLTVTVDGVEKAALVDDTGAYAVGYSGLDDTVTHQAKVVLSDEYGTDNIVLDEFTFSRVVALDGDLSLSAAQTDQRTVIASIFVSQLGVGESYAVLLSGTTSSDLVEVQRVRIEQVGSLAMLLEDRSWGETLACKIVLETVLKGETTAISTAVKSYTVNDVASYTWKSTVPEGNWGDSANWQSSLSSCIGYPSNISSRALFPAAAVRIKVDARYPIKEFCFGSNMTLWSDDTNKCAIVASDNTHLNSGYSVTFDHVVFSTPYRLLYGGGSLALTNGANVSFGRDLESSDGGRIVIDDSHLSVANVISCSGSTIELRGKSPVLTLTGAANGIVEKVAGKTSQVVFDIPSDGYAQPPIVGSGKSVELFANGSPDWMKLVGTGSATAAGCNHQPLIVWDGGVATSNLTTEVVGVSHGYFEYSEKIQESFKPWKDKPEGLSVRTVGFSAGKRGLVIMLR